MNLQGQKYFLSRFFSKNTPEVWAFAVFYKKHRAGRGGFSSGKFPAHSFNSF